MDAPSSSSWIVNVNVIVDIIRNVIVNIIRNVIINIIRNVIVNEM
jgi:hypothetical protein